VLDLALALVGVLALILAAGGAWLDRVPLSGPLVALLVGVLVGPEVSDLLRIAPGDELPILHTASRLTLAVSLMAVALRFPVVALRERGRPLLLLLVVVMPAMALTSAGIAAVTLGVGGGIALVLGAILAPTDPVLASSVLSGSRAETAVPETLRADLTLESGANDGLALPLVVLAVPLVTGGHPGTALLEAVWGIGGALLIGGALGWAAGRLLTSAERYGSVDRTHVATYSLVLALTGLGIGELARADALLLVFVAGLALNAGISSEDRRTEELVDESVHRLLILPLFVLLGLVLPWEQWRHLGLGGLGLVAGVLLLRRLPWVLLLHRSLRYRPAEAVWLGWFGPVGVAAVYYLTSVATRGVHEPIVYAAGTLVVVASTVAHGVTAAAGVDLIGRALRRDRRGRARRGPPPAASRSSRPGSSTA
jgi:sodium/hydrogen antiporter